MKSKIRTFVFAMLVCIATVAFIVFLLEEGAGPDFATSDYQVLGG